MFKGYVGASQQELLTAASAHPHYLVLPLQLKGSVKLPFLETCELANKLEFLCYRL